MKQFRNTDYYVTENGEVWRHFPKVEKYYANRSQPYITEEKWKQRKTHTNRGYETITIRVDGKRMNFKVHRMVAELYVPGYFEGAHVDHIDCNVKNNHYSNLQWCTKEYNQLKHDNPDYPLFR